MYITDNKYKKITITDLKAAIEQTALFKGFRHVNAAPLQVACDNERTQYWSDMHQKLLKLQTELTEKKQANENLHFKGKKR